MADRKIEFGTTLRTPNNIEALAQQIEGLGFDILGCGEHVSFHGDSANGFISLSVAAGVTNHIRLMSAITLVPLYPAALLAKLGAALDVASGGRYTMGVGVGGEFPPEFEACGVPVRQRGSRTDDALEVLTRVWSEADVTYEGRYTTLKNFSLKPLPVQKPRPPIYVSGRSESGDAPRCQIRGRMDSVHVYAGASRREYREDQGLRRRRGSRPLGLHVRPLYFQRRARG